MSKTPLRYEQAEAVSIEEIPLVDFAGFLNGDVCERTAVAERIGEACRSIGFFYIINHGVPEALRQRVLSQSKAFFSQGFQEKMRYAPIEDARWCGYLPARGAAEGSKPGASLVANEKIKRVSGGSLEQYNMMRVLLADDPNYGSSDPLYQKNPWPLGLPDFAETMIVNQRALLRLGEALMQAFSLALGLDEDYLARAHRSPLTAFGLNFYPAPTADEMDAGIGVGAHCDRSTFTVLLQDDVGGLEVQHASGRWIQAPYVPGAYVINIGETLMGWTNGHFVSTFHRVVSRKPQDRYSATMFINPDREVTVAPMERFVSAEQPARYPPFANEEYMRRFFVSFYDQMFKRK